MAAVSFHAYPYRDYETTEAEYSRLLDAALGGSGMLEDLTFSMSGMNLNAGALDGVVRGHRFVSPGGSFALEAATSARQALVGVRLDYSAQPVVMPFVKYGATLPVPVQTKDGVFELPLWSALVPANASSVGAGAVTPLWTRLRSPAQSLVFVQADRPSNPPLNSLRFW